ncbi:MAG: hypothetical protein JWP47_1322 [Polaromonas sp.]|nr:hypothetical protein [Polaromonas sp.]
MLILNRFNATQRLVAIAIACVFIAGPSLAKNDNDNDEHNGKGHGKHGEKHHAKDERKAEKHYAKEQKKALKRQREEIRQGAYFNDQQRVLARTYYVQTYGDGNKCPPGLARRNNGCMLPGQARTWAVGQPIPRGVMLYQVPQPVIVQLPPAPYGYRYARIGGDIVLVQQQNNLIVDIIVGLLG